MKQLSVDKVFAAAGGAAGLRDMLRSVGQPAPEDSNVIFMWSQRGQIPGKWTGAVLYALATVANIDPLDLLVESEVSAEELGL